MAEYEPHDPEGSENWLAAGSPLSPVDSSLSPPDETVVDAEIVDDAPRLWSAFLVAALAIGAATAVSTFMIVISAVVDAGIETVRDPAALRAWMREFVGTGFGLAILVLSSQLSFCAVALVAAKLSPERVVDRLGLRTGRLPAFSWPIFMVGTPIIGVFSAGLLRVVAGEPSDQLKLLDNLFTQHSANSLLLLVAMISVVPGIVEEIVFRGYVQRRFLQRLPVSTSIILASALFAIAHVDWMHALGVFPLGIWLGILAWRADSIWPAIFGHMGNNAYGILMAMLVGPEPDPESMGLPAALLGTSVVAFVASLVVLLGYRGTRGSGSADVVPNGD